MIVTNRKIWKILKEEKSIDNLIKNSSEDLATWIKETVQSYNDMYKLTEIMCKFQYSKEINSNMIREEVEEKIKKKDKNLQKIFLNLYDGKPIESLVWDRIRPKKSYHFKNQNTNEI